ncbi:MAG: RnfABCDGE type electron transport complex subunit D [Deltaproteobacteria bacterium]|nr:RnfABCDGE type electron transport complex subunit D [Deltaproteobacteria bacterium]
MSAHKFYVSMSPHLHRGMTVSKISRHILVALAPTMLVGVYYFGWSAVKVLLVCMIMAVAGEAGMQRIMGKKITLHDGHALTIGLLLGLMLPPGLPWWGAAVGALIAIVLGKQIYGGLGNNPFNPAAVGWIVLSVSYPGYMDLYHAPLTGLKSFTTSPAAADLPLKLVREDLSELISYPPWDLLIGLKAGGIGEVCILALVLGGLYLILKRVITWHVPVACLGVAWIFSLLFSQIDPETYAGPSFHLLSGGLVFASFFLATDKGTMPVTAPGMLLAGAMVALITMIIRYWGGYVDGVYFAILLTNAVVPLMDRIRPAVYGRVKEVA